MIKNTKQFKKALEKYVKGEISLGRAAELAKMPLADFMKMAAERKVAVNYSLDSLKEDFKAAIKYAKSK